MSAADVDPGSEWFRAAFAADYLDLYHHRDDASAAREVAWIAETLGIEPRHVVLDVACGSGRHVAAWSRRGNTAIGLDLSSDLLAAARSRMLANAAFLAGDMRALPFRGCFDLATSLFTSFGYFADESDDQRVLDGIGAALVPGGRVVLDFLAADAVRRSLVPSSIERRGEVEITQERSISSDGKRVEKRVTLRGPEGERRHRESVRLWELADFERMFAAAGLRIDAVFGGLAGQPRDQGDRLVILGRSGDRSAT